MSMTKNKRPINKQVTEEQLRELYTEYNNLMFNGKLTEDITIEWSKRMTRSAGSCEQRINRLTQKVVEVKIKLGVAYHEEHPSEVMDTLVHEMIHVNNPNDGHGASFQADCRRINESFGMSLKTRADKGVTPPVIYKCKDCGATFGRFRKMSTTKYRHGCTEKGDNLELIKDNRK